MSVYFIAQININNNNIYQQYINSAGEVFSKYKGSYLAVDDSPVCLEGFWDEGRIVLIEFPSKKDFNDWYYSAEYQEILNYWFKGAICNTILITGK
ncbi:DUF1330 domain-containing protein [uncultured Draconibacterium sp.]|uniref:DUF1330 domain-containing protein n=1 Tax=uncultured Draconibacterium sp. TaxID=1573823 RepID=UPI003260EF65